MRLWNIHPKYLDDKALLQCWNEAIGAQSCLHAHLYNHTSLRYCKYIRHPQLEKFKEFDLDALHVLGVYLFHLYMAGETRNMKLPYGKISTLFEIQSILHTTPISVLQEQLESEFEYLLTRMKDRCPRKYELLLLASKQEGFQIEPHPMMYIVNELQEQVSNG